MTMAASRDFLSSVRSKVRTFRSTDLGEDLPPRTKAILGTADDMKRLIHKDKKSEFLTVSRPHDQFATCQDRALQALFVAKGDIANNFNGFKKQEANLSDAMKTWEKRCDQVLSARTDCIKAFGDFRKSKDRLSSLPASKPDEVRSAKAQAEEMEANFFVKKADMLTESHRFSLEEDERMQCVREYMEALKRFFDESSSYLSTQINKLASVLDSHQKTYFGTSLKDHLNDNGYSVVIETCVTYLIRKGGCQSEGLFRLAGHMSKIEILRQAFDRHKVDDELLDYCGVNVVGDVLKQYLRQMQEPLMTDDFVDGWLSQKNRMTPEIAYSLLCSMPETNKKNIIMIIRLLGKITENVDKTKMTPQNLATVLYMSFYRRGDTSASPDVVNIVTYVSEHAAEILKDDNETGLVVPMASPGVNSPPPTFPSGNPLAHSASKPKVPSRTYGRTTPTPTSADLKTPPPPSNPPRPLAPMAASSQDATANRTSVLLQAAPTAAVPLPPADAKKKKKAPEAPRSADPSASLKTKSSDESKQQPNGPADDSVVKSKSPTPSASEKESSSDSDTSSEKEKEPSKTVEEPSKKVEEPSKKGDEEEQEDEKSSSSSSSSSDSDSSSSSESEEDFKKDKDSKEDEDSKEGKESKKDKHSKGDKDSKEDKESKEDKDSKEDEESKKDKHSKGHKNTKEDKESKEDKDSKEDEESKKDKHSKGHKNTKEDKESKEDKDSKEDEESKKDKHSKGHKNTKEDKESKEDKDSKEDKGSKSAYSSAGMSKMSAKEQEWNKIMMQSKKL